MRVDDILNNFLQENGFDCHAVYDIEADSYYSIYEEEIVLGGQPDAVADRVFMKYVKELGLIGEWNINTLTFMHELSHHLTLHLLDEEEIEIGKQALEQQKIDRDTYTKRYEAKQKREIEDQKIQLAKEQMKHETELQKQKDKAAMEREELKARTALKNKTSGEK